ncbi:hypothetical protein L798_07501 [Zootermopsis nevadensis]|uniref:Uncharacterized protein n=1 Tax=Zootermopsis nevadensis TaxID=136037 RepID=A0A067RCU3_ZOONE|nr:hypothetical protein L798_07501 [Zootermopsis nevadensis]
MDTNSSLRVHRVLEMALLVFVLTILRTDCTPVSNIDKSSNITSPENVVTVNKTNSSMDYSTGDSYLDEAYFGCVIARDMSTCVKYEALKYIHEVTSPFKGSSDNGTSRRSELNLWGPLKLIALPPSEEPTKVQQMFSDSSPRSTDSELMRLFRFTLRQVERFVRAYSLAINVPTRLSSDGGAEDFETPRIIDDDFFSSSLKGVAGRGKKKTMMYLLPLISFFHLKALLVPILLAVLFIKKVLILAIIFLPSLLSLVKWCKPMHHQHTPWYPEHEPHAEYHSEYFPHYGKEYASRRRSREIGQAMAYQAYRNDKSY